MKGRNKQEKKMNGQMMMTAWVWLALASTLSLEKGRGEGRREEERGPTRPESGKRRDEKAKKTNRRDLARQIGSLSGQGTRRATALCSQGAQERTE